MNIKKLIILLLVSSLAMPMPAFAKDEPNGGEMMVDLVIARPLGIVATALGAIVFVVATPFTLATGTWKKSAKKLVGNPAKYTFKRELGVFSGKIEDPLNEETDEDFVDYDD